MAHTNDQDLEITLFNQLLGSALILVVLFGLAHNVFLSSGSTLTGPIPSTHPLTAFGFFILAMAMFFRPQWKRHELLRTLLCLAMVLLSCVRLAEALLPAHVTLFSDGVVTRWLAAIGLHGRFSVETAVFFLSSFVFELTSRKHQVTRLLLLSVCLAILSFGFAQAVYSLFLWGNELSLITQIAMWLVCIDLLARMRRVRPFQPVFRGNGAGFFLQFTALALYLLPIVIGAVALKTLDVSPADRVPFEIVFAATSCLMLLIVLAAGNYLERGDTFHQPASPRDQEGRPGSLSSEDQAS